MFSAWRKKKAQAACNHEFEVVSRGRAQYSSMGCSSVDVDYYIDTTATCIHCDLKKKLSSESVTYIEDGKLVKVLEDPLNVYPAECKI